MSSDYPNIELKPKLDEPDDDDGYVPAGLSNMAQETKLNENSGRIDDFYTSPQVEAVVENGDQPKVYADLTSLTPKVVKEEVVEKNEETRKGVVREPELTEMRPMVLKTSSNPPALPIAISRPLPLPMMLPMPAIQPPINPNYFHRSAHPHYYPPPSFPLAPVLPQSQPYFPVRFQPGTNFDPQYHIPFSPIPLATNRVPGMYMVMVNGAMQNDPNVLNIQRQLVKNQKQHELEAKKLEIAKKKEERLKRLEKAKAEKEERKQNAKLAKLEARKKRSAAAPKYSLKSGKRKEKERHSSEPSTKRYMAFAKDTFVVRLRDVDSFDRNNEIWRIDNHVLIQKFTGVPSLRAPARQFQSTNRLSGYDMRAVWRFFVIDPETVEFDRFSSEITIHSFPGITELREAQKMAAERDLQFKDVELDELDMKFEELRNKKIKRREEKLAKRFEKMQRRTATARNGRSKNNRQNAKKVETAYKLPKKFKRNGQKRNEEENVVEICRDVLSSLVDAVVEHVHLGGNDENSSDSATDSDGSGYDIDLRSVYSEKEHYDGEMDEEVEDEEELYEEEVIGYDDNGYEYFPNFEEPHSEVKVEIYGEDDIPAVALELTIENS